MPYRTIDLCAGIGGIRKGFERTGGYKNVLSSELDLFARKTYEHLFGDKPCSDLTDESFKVYLEKTDYEVLLAGFPCQSFSRAGLKEGFHNESHGIIFDHIACIIKRTHPRAIFLENVDHLIIHDKGATFNHIIEILESELNYKIIGVTRGKHGELQFNPRTFVRNSKHFGVPQNRPRTYIVGFDRARFEKSDQLDVALPERSNRVIYHNLNEVLEFNASPKYYLAQGYFNTLVAHRQREYIKGNGFGYKIINEAGIECPVANTLLATGGSGKERNLVYDIQKGIPGAIVKYKKTPLNNRCIRFLTPIEWGKLQGFINYAFINKEGIDEFSFPEGISDAQKYKQFGNSVTIPVIEKMADFMLNCLSLLDDKMPEVS